MLVICLFYEAFSQFYGFELLSLHTSKNSVMFVAFLGPYVGHWLFGDASYYSGFSL